VHYTKHFPGSPESTGHLVINEQYPISDYTEFRHNIAELRDHGFRLALDDVGVGYSSLRTLYELRPDYVKIDHSLIRRIHEEPVHQRVLDVFRDISGELDALMIAEGIEIPEELDYVKSLGIPYAQGFSLGYPQEKVA